MSTAGGIARYQGDYVAARTFSDEALAIARELGDRSETARALGNLGMVAMRQGEAPSPNMLRARSISSGVKGRPSCIVNDVGARTCKAKQSALAAS